MSTPGTSSAARSHPTAAGASSATGSQVQAARASPPVSHVAVARLGSSDSATAGTEDVLVDDDVQVGSKRKIKSAVWLEFDRVKINEVWKAKCQWCRNC